MSIELSPGPPFAGMASAPVDTAALGDPSFSIGLGAISGQHICWEKLTHVHNIFVFLQNKFIVLCVCVYWSSGGVGLLIFTGKGRNSRRVSMHTPTNAITKCPL